MKPQLFVGQAPERSKFNAPMNEQWYKPSGGLWTSTFDDQYGSDWIQFMHNQGWYGSGATDAWMLYPIDNVNIYTIDCELDYKKLFKTYPYHKKYLNYEKLARIYDGIHMTRSGVCDTQNDLWGWDVESTLWLRWRFYYVKKLPWTIYKYKMY